MRIVFSHHQVAFKNKVIVQIIVRGPVVHSSVDAFHSCCGVLLCGVVAFQNQICSCEPSLVEGLKSSLELLTGLGRVENSKVALLARQMLIAVQTPPYELRHNQCESIFLG